MQLGKTDTGKNGVKTPPSADAAEFYGTLFDVRIAQTAEDVTLAQALRYRVYCEEAAFLPTGANPGGLERDVYDSRSATVLLIHRATQHCIGTVRIILPDPTAPHGGQPARLSSADMMALGDGVMPIATTGEISRFTIAPEFRRRSGDTLYQQVYNIDEKNGDARRVIPYMALGLFAGIFEIVVTHKLTHLCAIIDPALLRMLRRLYLRFTPVGDIVNFHGKRQPVFTSCADLHEGVLQLPESHLRIVNKNGTLDI